MAAGAWYSKTRSVYCIGRNYLAHANELNNAVPKKPFWFMKPASSIISSGTPHESPPTGNATHHELELGVVIGSRCQRVSAPQAMAHVSGYCLALDMTDRVAQDLAKSEGKPWTAAKGWHTSLPVSDFVPVSRVADHTALHMWLKLNGEATPRQHGCPARMVFDLPALIAAVSAVHTLEPGDLLLTGTPEGVGPAMPGDTITAGITELDIEICVPVIAPSSVQ